jgi:epoxyqueuosine reductase QueG
LKILFLTIIPKINSNRMGSSLVAFADADDKLFRKFKEIISKSHATPKELLPEAKTVVSYFIPFSKEIALGNVGGKIVLKGGQLRMLRQTTDLEFKRPDCKGN